MKESNTELAHRLLARGAALKNERGPWDAFWQDCARFVAPRKAAFFTSSSSPGAGYEAELFDTTAIRANQILANGQMSYTTPAGTRWFAYEAPPGLRGNDRAEQWFSACTEIIQILLARSNFYTEIHELYLDRGGFGTSVMFAEAGRSNPLRFETFPIGSFSLAESDEGLIDTVYREFKLTARQARQKFGEENVPEAVRKALACGDGKAQDQEFDFVHCVYPREEDEREAGKLDPENMPVASVYIEASSRHVCEVGGYPEMPAFATRFLKWGRSVYGWSPSWMALPESKQKNFLEKNLDALAEVQAWPRLLVPSSLEGEIDLSAGGMTFFDPANPSGVPREWATGGQYPIGVERSDRKRDAIEKAFHVDMFQMFAQLDKNMTAREVAERSAEKLVQFSPTFSRMTTEIYNPLLLRVFRIVGRLGLLPPPPREIVMAGNNGPAIPEPQVSYSSRIALAIQALENMSFVRVMEYLAPLIPVKPELLDNFDLDTILRDMARNDGSPARWLVDVEARDAMRAQRAQQAAAAQQLEQAKTLSEGVRNVGGAEAIAALAGGAK